MPKGPYQFHEMTFLNYCVNITRTSVALTSIFSEAILGVCGDGTGWNRK